MNIFQHSGIKHFNFPIFHFSFNVEYTYLLAVDRNVIYSNYTLDNVTQILVVPTYPTYII